MECNKVLQNATECRCLIHKVLQNAEGETTAYYKVMHKLINPLTDDKVLDWSKLKQSAEDNFEFDVNSRKFL